jgi:hypothetical protein
MQPNRGNALLIKLPKFYWSYEHNTKIVVTPSLNLCQTILLKGEIIKAFV